MQSELKKYQKKFGVQKNSSKRRNGDIGKTNKNLPPTISEKSENLLASNLPAPTTISREGFEASQNERFSQNLDQVLSFSSTSDSTNPTIEHFLTQSNCAERFHTEFNPTNRNSSLYVSCPPNRNDVLQGNHLFGTGDSQKSFYWPKNKAPKTDFERISFIESGSRTAPGTLLKKKSALPKSSIELAHQCNDNRQLRCSSAMGGFLSHENDFGVNSRFQKDSSKSIYTSLDQHQSNSLLASVPVVDAPSNRVQKPKCYKSVQHLPISRGTDLSPLTERFHLQQSSPSIQADLKERKKIFGTASSFGSTKQLSKEQKGKLSIVASSTATTTKL